MLNRIELTRINQGQHRRVLAFPDYAPNLLYSLTYQGVMSIEDLTGKTINRLTVTKMLPKYKQNSQGRYLTYCLCDCACGKRNVVVAASKLKSGHTQSCGCLQRERAAESVSSATKTHGLSKTKSYAVWRAMKSRCLNPSDKNYDYYGGRGIAICDEWRNSFEQFHDWLTDNGYCGEDGRNTGFTIDRIDVDGNYEPSNCRVVSIACQANNKRTNRLITYNGETHTCAEWARKLNIGYKAFMDRVYRNWPIERIMTQQ